MFGRHPSLVMIFPSRACELAACVRCPISAVAVHHSVPDDIEPKGRMLVFQPAEQCVQRGWTSRY